MELNPLKPLVSDSIAIIGFGPTRDAAPWNDESWGEVWICNRLALQPDVTRWTRHFDPHPLQWSKDHFSINQQKPELWTEYEDFFQKDHGDKLIYLPEATPGIPNLVLFPVDEILERVGRRYMTSVIAWQMGLALLLKPRRVGLWGVDFRSATEYEFERPCVEYLMGRLEGEGVEVVVPPEAAMLNQDLNSPLYGIEELKTPLADMERHINSRLIEIDEKHRKLVEKNDQILRELYIGEGAKLQSEAYLNLLRLARRGGPIREIKGV